MEPRLKIKLMRALRQMYTGIHRVGSWNRRTVQPAARVWNDRAIDLFRYITDAPAPMASVA